MPADNVHGWRADTLARLRELGGTVYRWPGGNFVSGYDWKDGIGDPDRRPPRKNPAWKGVEANDVGLHEFMDLMQMLGAEPYVAVNTGLGGAGSAAELVAYANGKKETPMGKLRARNGHPQPFGVSLWAVGNEMYGQWQLGHMSLADYVAKHKEIVRAMRAADPKIQLVAVGAVGDWSKTMLSEAASDMTFISEHNYWQGKDDVVAHVAQVPAAIRKVADAYRGYRRDIPALAGTDIRIAFDEWNYWYGPFEYGELGVRYTLKDALGIAAGLHELARQSDLFAMANCAQTVNVLGAIKTTADAAELEPNGLVLALYRHHFGTIPVAVSEVPSPLDVAAAFTTGDRRALTIAVVNPTARARRLRPELRGVTLTGLGRRFVMTGAGPLAHNEPGRPRGVDVAETGHRERLGSSRGPRLQRGAVRVRSRRSRRRARLRAMSSSDAILSVSPLGFPWQPRDPFLFCVHHDDRYPRGQRADGAGRDARGARPRPGLRGARRLAHVPRRGGPRLSPASAPRLRDGDDRAPRALRSLRLRRRGGPLRRGGRAVADGRRRHPALGDVPAASTPSGRTRSSCFRSGSICRAPRRWSRRTSRCSGAGRSRAGW